MLIFLILLKSIESLVFVVDVFLFFVTGFSVVVKVMTIKTGHLWFVSFVLIAFVNIPPLSSLTCINIVMYFFIFLIVNVQERYLCLKHPLFQIFFSCYFDLMGVSANTGRCFRRGYFMCKDGTSVWWIHAPIIKLDVFTLFHF